jgi:hypothetical protein
MDRLTYSIPRPGLVQIRRGTQSNCTKTLVRTESTAAPDISAEVSPHRCSKLPLDPVRHVALTANVSQYPELGGTIHPTIGSPATVGSAPPGVFFTGIPGPEAGVTAPSASSGGRKIPNVTTGTQGVGNWTVPVSSADHDLPSLLGPAVMIGGWIVLGLI